ncbi:MAG TPA: Fur family transcriptional regulator [Candidatus Dormibacteraeota bacterium]|nr:Fur family transcriptional regulator [Candidatus Dormibacteraeota bacterium]
MDVAKADAGLIQSRYRLTRQRAAVLHVLQTDGGHLDAEAIHERAKQELPSLGLATIYRTLDLLRELGLVQMVQFPGTAARYEARLDKHYHLLCARCHQLSDVEAPRLSSMVGEIADGVGFHPQDVTLVVSGLCRRCRR